MDRGTRSKELLVDLNQARVLSISAPLSSRDPSTEGDSLPGERFTFHPESRLGSMALKAAAHPLPESPGSGNDRRNEVGGLFREHNQTLVRFLRARLGSEQEAREVAQEAYVKLLQLERIGAVSFMRAYLFRIAANLAVDRIRQRNSQGAHEDIELFEHLEDAAAPERAAIATEQLRLISRALAELPPKCAEAFVLHRFQGMDLMTVAAKLGITDRMVRIHVLRALMYCQLRLDGVPQDEAWKRAKE